MQICTPPVIVAVHGFKNLYRTVQGCTILSMILIIFQFDKTDVMGMCNIEKKGMCLEMKNRPRNWLYIVGTHLYMVEHNCKWFYIVLHISTWSPYTLKLKQWYPQ